MQQDILLQKDIENALDVDATRVTTYSLLAHINNGSGAGIADLSDIFVPLVKRSLAKMNKGVVTKGESLLEIKSVVDSQYQLDIPIPFLQALLQRIAREVNVDGQEHIKLFSDGGFIIKNFIFSDIEEAFSRQETEVEILSQAFDDFLSLRGETSSLQSSIFDFLDKNRASLSCYFANKKSVVTDTDDSIHAEFIESIKSDSTLYGTLKKVYLGSIISGYLEINVSEITSGVEFLLDTNFLLGLLDLTSPESNHTCLKLIEVCRRLGHRLTVLDDTIEETSNLLKIVALKIEDAVLIRKLDKETIESGCDRRGLTRTDLQRIAANLSESILNLGVLKIPHTLVYKNKAKYSPVFETFKSIRNSSRGALHDATAVIYVKDKRGKKITDFYEAKCWFVTNTKRTVSYHEKGEFIPEIIRVEDLMNILWLTSPNVTNAEMLDVGLTRLISSAYSNSLPTNRLLRHLDEKIGIYAKGIVDPKDIVLLANAVADKTVQNLGRLETATGDNFVAEIQFAARAEEAKQKLRDERTKNILVEKSKESEQRIEQIKTDLVQRSQSDLEDVAERLTSVHGRELLRRELQSCKSILKDKKEQKERLEDLEARYSKDATQSANMRSVSVAVLVPVFAILALIRFGWNVLEPYTFILGLVVLSVAFVLFISAKIDFSYQGLRDHLASKRKKRLFEKYGFSEKELTDINSQVTKLNEEITKLNQALDFENETASMA